ncbi:cytochrome b [Candidatus Tokpelaia sp.]|uniref:cytochrome b n=1 Tax=Candidatus Tokpelaia sp. TaxID=2233777 RepID=UPI001238D7B9|nr:cytochrome b/b6 domain-containing protein [Candidatus Tokpelaia sp.]KAA6405842.1 hypothetical protein DPQ22_02405 [Candidatus Tokpelaia sp.]
MYYNFGFFRLSTIYKTSLFEESLMPASPRYKSVAAYNHGAMLLHWLMAFLLVWQLVFGYLMRHTHSLPESFIPVSWQIHKTFGVLVLLLALMRLAWRFLYKPPADLPIGKAEKAATQIVTFLFYALMILVPLLGWAIVSTSSRNIPTLLFGNPHLVWPPLPPQFVFISHSQAEQAHTVLAYSFIFLLFLHICGALKHQFYDHMPMIARMVPGHILQAQKAGKSAFLLLFLAVFCLAAVMIYFGFVGTQQEGLADAAARAAAATGFGNAGQAADYR